MSEHEVSSEKRQGISRASSARMAALDIGRRVREREAYAHELLHSSALLSCLSKEDRAFATLLVLGVVSASGTLDEIINHWVRKSVDLQPAVRDALRLSVYEIIFLNKSPHAAVDQGVELVRFVQPRACGLANAVLHKVVAQKKSFPFADPRKDLAALARLYAFPVWLTRRLMSDIGPREAVSFMQASNEQAPLFVAVNEFASSCQEVQAHLQKEGVAFEKVCLQEKLIPGCLRLEDAGVLQQTVLKRLFAQGKLLVSDASSQFVVDQSMPSAMPASFLEVGAGRGTKTILLQNAALRHYGSPVQLSTIDNHTFKTKLLQKRLSDYKIEVSQAYTGDATDLSKVVGNKTYDSILVDAPCSGLGTLRRHPEIRWRLTQQHIDDLATLSLSLLRSAAARVTEAGQLVFSTCTVTQAENASVVKRFLDSEEGQAFELAPLKGQSHLSTTFYPGSSDAHFAARFIKSHP